MAGLKPSIMENPLVVWVQTFSPDNAPATYDDLISGVYLNNVMHQIDPRANLDLVSTPENIKDRIQNWDVLMKNIKTYYQDVLQQYIVMKRPNILKICKEPETDIAKEELNNVLLLLLGCAIQCEQKEAYVQNIQGLDIPVQEDIVEYIKEITEDSKNVFAMDIPLDQLDEVTHSLVTHLRALIQERDGYVDEIKELSQNLEEVLQAQKDMAAAPVAPTPAPEVASSPEKAHHHLGVELAEAKAKLRTVRQELEEKNEHNGELQEELLQTKSMVTKLRNENLTLTQDAAAARAYRDELDILKEKVSRVDRYEAEIGKYKERLNELEFYKARVQELREENDILLETKHTLEDQVNSDSKKIEAVLDLEKDLTEYKKKIAELAKERDEDRQKIQELVEEKTKLEFEMKTSFSESANLEDELHRAREKLNKETSSNLEGQLRESSNAKVLRLELENKRLQRLLQESRENVVLENTTKVVEMEKQNSRLAKKVEKLQESLRSDSQSFLEIQELNHNLVREKEDLKQTIETIKEDSERQVKELELENEHLSQTVSVLRKRNEQTQDLRVKDIEKENKRLNEKNQTLMSQMSKNEHEVRQLKKVCTQLEGSTEHIQELEDENQRLDTEVNELHKTVATLKAVSDNYEKVEQEVSDLQIENNELQKVVKKQKNTISIMEAREQDNINLTVENQRLQKSCEALKVQCTKQAAVEQEKEQIEAEVTALKKSLEVLQAGKDKHEKLQTELAESSQEIFKMKHSLQLSSQKIKRVEHDNQQLENQNQELQKVVDDLQLQVKKLEGIDKEIKKFEQENSKLQVEETALMKETKRLKQSLATKDTTVQNLSSQVAELERENRTVRKRLERSMDSSNKVEEMQHELSEITHRAALDKETISGLREELMKEKMRTQDLTDKLQDLGRDLHKISFEREKLVLAERDQEEEKFKNLEATVQKTFKGSVQMKEEKIRSLQTKLEESEHTKTLLREELQTAKKRYEALQQRREEEVYHIRTMEKERIGVQKASEVSATRRVLEQNDRLITVERQNATLEAENKNLKFHNAELTTRAEQLETHNHKLQSQSSALQSKYQALQSQNAKLQVDYATTQSQNSALATQFASLEKDKAHIEAELRHAHNQSQSNSEILRDQETLQRLHNELSRNYEELISKHGSLKANYKSQSTELKDAKDEINNLKRACQDVAREKETLQKQLSDLNREKTSTGSLHGEHFQLQTKYTTLKNANDSLNKEYRDLLTEHKSLKTEHLQIKSQLTEAQDNLRTLDVEYDKLVFRYEALAELNGKLEEDNRSLMIQVQALLNQKQDILTQSLENKEVAHENELAYMEKLADLRRQKEKLEEKIMEQYKRYDPEKKKHRGFGATLVRKAKDLMQRNSNRRDKGKSYSLSPENSSMGSGSGGSSNHLSVKYDKREARRKSANMLLDSPNLATQQRQFVRSTTALNVMSHQPTEGALSLRSAKSSDNLGGDADSLDSSGSEMWGPRGGRRRTHKDSEHSVTHAPQGSMSSEDNTPYPESVSVIRTTQRTSMVLRPRSAIVGQDEEGGDRKITLLEFLKEVDRSPKSRRKLMKAKKIDLSKSENDLTKLTEKLEDVPLRPKSPLIERDDKESSPDEPRNANTPSAYTQAPQQMTSGLSGYGDRKPSMPTLTKPNAFHGYPEDSQLSRQHSRRSQGTDEEVNRHAARLRESITQFNQKHNGNDSDHSGTESSYSGRNRPVTDYPTSHGGVQHPNQSPLKLPETGGVAPVIMRKPNSPRERPMSVGPSLSLLQNTLNTAPSLPRHVPSNNNDYSGGHHPVLKRSTTVGMDSTDTRLRDASQPSGVNGDSGVMSRSQSVRNLIQSFQASPNNGGKEPPEPPPRRHRPLTPGPEFSRPNRPYNQMPPGPPNGNIGAPRFRSMTPGPGTDNCVTSSQSAHQGEPLNGTGPGPAPRVSGTRVLPQTPAERKRPPSAPPRQQSQPGNPEKKSSIWINSTSHW